MAMTFSSTGCRTAAENLMTSSKELDTILNEDLTSIVEKAKNIYQSNSANELYELYNKVKAKFPQFIDSISECSKYLTDTVATSYEKVEKSVSDSVN